MKERFKWIIGFNGLYKVSNLGRIYSVKRHDRLNRLKGGKFIKIRKNHNGYCIVSLNKDGAQHTFLLHRLVAQAFLNNPHKKAEVDHINGDKSDNSVDNLRWCSRIENINNPITYSKMSDNAKKNPVSGIKNPFSKRVAQYSTDGIFICEYESTGIVSLKTGVSIHSIQRCALGKRKNGGGFIWKYTSEPKMYAKGRRPMGTNGIAVSQIDQLGNIVANYVSIQDAARKTGFCAENIGRAVSGIYKTYKGFKWTRITV